MPGAWLAAVIAVGAAQPAYPPLDTLMLPEPARSEAYPQGPMNARDPDDPRFGERSYADLVAAVPPARNEGRAWRVWDAEWSETDRRGYEAFVQAIGRSGCVSLDDCLKSDANPFRATDAWHRAIWYGDCADMAYVLRAYYAWKRGLPFAYATAVEIRGGNKRGGRDPRFSKLGNRVSDWAEVTTLEGAAPTDAMSVVPHLYPLVHTGTFRTHPEDEERWSDHYPIRIARESVRPGMVAYDVYGHVGIVYEVEADGTVLIVASHPDQTVTRGVFGANFARSGPEFGGGLKAWRPASLVGAKRSARGDLVGGRVRRARNAQVTDYSLEAYGGTNGAEDWRLADYVHEGRTLSWPDFVRARLRDPSYETDPVTEVSRAYAALCADAHARKQAVQVAVRRGLWQLDHPPRLPENIYGTHGEWETYATPSRDARFKTQSLEVRRLVERHVREGADRDALADAAERGLSRCTVRYARTDGSVVKLDLGDVVDRLWALSFDPYHCPERRWGASGRERSTCIETPDKAVWYEAQRWLRADPERRYDARMDFRADELRDPAMAPPEAGGLGRSVPPDADVWPLLREEGPSHRREGLDFNASVAGVTGTVNDEGGGE